MSGLTDPDSDEEIEDTSNTRVGVGHTQITPQVTVTASSNSSKQKRTIQESGAVASNPKLRSPGESIMSRMTQAASHAPLNASRATESRSRVEDVNRSKGELLDVNPSNEMTNQERRRSEAGAEAKEEVPHASTGEGLPTRSASEPSKANESRKWRSGMWTGD